MKTKIYGLVDPRTHRVEYIGRSVNPTTRLYQHTIEAGSGRTRPVKQSEIGTTSSKGVWIRALAKENLLPSLVILDEVEEEESRASELRWITHFRLLGSTGNAVVAGSGRLSWDKAPGLSLKAWRLSKGLTLQDLANELDVSEGAVSRWENGNRILRGPALVALERIGFRLEP